ncbi:hypothetical protein ACFLV3_06510 [Chloroflexota bacterium]
MIIGKIEGLAMPLVGRIKMYWRFARELRRFLKEPITLEQSQEIIRQRLENREQNLLAVVKRAIYENERSPYLKLLRMAGCEYGDFEEMVRTDGIETTLKTLCDRGVYVSIEEFKGKKEATRGGRVFCFKESDFDNPFLSGHLQAESSGSRSAGTRSLYDLNFLAANFVTYNLPMLNALSALNLPIAIWMPAMPGAGPLNLLAYTKGGNTPTKWFSPLESSGFRPSLTSRLATSYIVLMGRLVGVKWPQPEYVAYDEATKVARWLADATRETAGCTLDSYTSAVVRVCRAARESGLDISLTRFIIGGEPLTDAKLREIESVGARACVVYGISEAGFVGGACFNPAATDDIHLFEDSFALIQRQRRVLHADVSVDAFLLTSLLPSAPKVLFNMETGDCGVVTDRSCGCPLSELGFTRHLHNIRGFDRLTSEGMNFFGSNLVRIIEEVLPSKFGGASTNYQMVEDEDEQGHTRLYLIVSPDIGPLDDEVLIQTVLVELTKGRDTERMMAQVWSRAKTLRVKRRQPITTGSGKLLPLHIQKEK